MVFNAIFNNISDISWKSVLLVECQEKKHRTVAGCWQTLSHNVVLSTPCHKQDSNSQCERLSSLVKCMFNTKRPSIDINILLIYMYIYMKLWDIKTNCAYMKVSNDYMYQEGSAICTCILPYFPLLTVFEMIKHSF